jgi:hypothetical protein
MPGQESGPDEHDALGGDSDPWSEPDYALQALVGIANNASVEVGIRLTLPGQIVSGTLISVVQHFELLAKNLLDGLESDAGNAARYLGGSYAALAEDFRDQIEAERSQADSPPVSPGYIHLKDAWLYSAGSSPLEIGLWRGRLSQIVGWSLGNYTSSQD